MVKLSEMIKKFYFLLLQILEGVGCVYSLLITFTNLLRGLFCFVIVTYQIHLVLPARIFNIMTQNHLTEDLSLLIISFVLQITTIDLPSILLPHDIGYYSFSIL